MACTLFIWGFFVLLEKMCAKQKLFVLQNCYFFLCECGLRSPLLLSIQGHIHTSDPIPRLSRGKSF